MADLDKLLGKYDAPRQPAAELKPYEFPWYDRLTNWATDMLYGDRATAQQRSGMNTVLGPDNPFNLPAQFTRGSGNVATGVRRGDPYQIAEGALEAGLSGLPIYAGARSAAGAFRGRPTPVPEGPWTMSPQEFGTWRDFQPQVMPESKDALLQRISRIDNAIPADVRGALDRTRFFPNEERLSTRVSAMKAGPERDQMAADLATIQGGPLDARSGMRQRSALEDQLRAYEDANPRPLPPTLEVAQSNFDLQGGKAIEHLLGLYGPNVPPGGRPWTARHDLTKVLDSELSHSDMANLLTRSMRNNEHLPKVANEARGIMHDLDAAAYDVKRMDGIAHEQAVNQRKIDQKWQRATGHYEEEFGKFHPNGFLMEPHELREILQQHYGVTNNASHDIIAKAYRKFAADEYVASKTGKPTWHDRYQQMAQNEADRMLERDTGIKITDDASRNAAYDAAYDVERIKRRSAELQDEMGPNRKASGPPLDAIPPFLGLVGGIAGAKNVSDNVDTSDILRRILDQYRDHGYRP